MAEGHEVNHEETLEESDHDKASSSRRKRSNVWEFFVNRGQKALCKVCENEYAYHRGNSNLRDHLVHVHPLKLRPPEDQPCLNAYLSKVKCPESRAKKITEYIVGMVVRDLCPTAMVEGWDFEHL